MDAFKAALAGGPALLTTRTADEERHATAFLFDAATQLVTQQQDGVLLVTPTSEGLDAAVADGFAVRGLHKLEIRYCQTVSELRVLLGALHLSPDPIGVVLIDRLGALLDDCPQQEREVNLARTLAFAIEACGAEAGGRQLAVSITTTSAVQKRLLDGLFPAPFLPQADGDFKRGG